MRENNVLHLDTHIVQPWPEDAAWMNSFTGTFYAAATLMVAQRLLLRLLRYGSPLGLDDFLIFISWAAATAFFIECTLILTSLDHGVPVQPTKFAFMAMMLWAIEVTFIMSQGCIKLGVLAILNRFVKATADTRIRYAIYGAATLTVGYSMVMLCLAFAACQPLAGFWRGFEPKNDANPDYKLQCINKKAASILAGLCAVLSDIYTIAIPWAISRSFGLHKRQTLALNIVFMFGLVVTVASGVRTYYLYSVYTGSKTNTPHDTVHLIMWATVEVQVAIICACAPSLRVLYRLIVGSSISQTVHQRYFSRPGNSYNSRTGLSNQTGISNQTGLSAQTGLSTQTGDSYDSGQTTLCPEMEMIQKEL